MHPNNVYDKHPPSFRKLGEVYPDLMPYVKTNAKGKPVLNFQNEEAVRQLTYALLKRDFGLTVKLPDNRLCPGVPGRLDYTLWIRDILDAAEDADDSKAPWGVDVGTGASAIYPLLLTHALPKLSIVGTDIDAQSLACARKNLQDNNLLKRITILDTSNSHHILPSELSKHASSPNVDPARTFTMCNPPFYSSKEEMEAAAAEKEDGPHSVTTVSVSEQITQGGEVEFVGRMIDESLGHKTTIRWFSSLCGKLSSITHLITKYHYLGGDNYGIIELAQAHTNRWVFVWSWQNHRLPDSISRAFFTSRSGILPRPNELHYFCPTTVTYDVASSSVPEILASIDLIPKTVPSPPYTKSTEEFPTKSWYFVAAENTWSRSARRKRKFEGAAKSTSGPDPNTALLSAILTVSFPPPLISKSKRNPNKYAQVSSSPPQSDGSEPQESSSPKALEKSPPKLPQVKIDLRWVRGRDRLAFEALHAHLTKRIMAVGNPQELNADEMDLS